VPVLIIDCLMWTYALDLLNLIEINTLEMVWRFNVSTTFVHSGLDRW